MNRRQTSLQPITHKRKNNKQLSAATGPDKTGLCHFSCDVQNNFYQPKTVKCAPGPLDNQYLISRDMCHITEGGVIQAQELQGPLQLLERIEAALARLNAEKEKESLFRRSLII